MLRLQDVTPFGMNTSTNRSPKAVKNDYVEYK